MFSEDGAKAVEAQLVHQAVEQSRRAVLVHAKLAALRIVVVLLDVGALRRRATDAHHPQEFVYVCKEKEINFGG